MVWNGKRKCTTWKGLLKPIATVNSCGLPREIFLSTRIPWSTEKPFQALLPIPSICFSIIAFSRGLHCTNYYHQTEPSPYRQQIEPPSISLFDVVHMNKAVLVSKESEVLRWGSETNQLIRIKLPAKHGWRSGKSTNMARVRFPVQPSYRMWTEFIGSSLSWERFFLGYSGFPYSPKTNIWFYLLWFSFICSLLN